MIIMRYCANDATILTEAESDMYNLIVEIEM